MPSPSGSCTTAAPTWRISIARLASRSVWSGPIVSTSVLMPSRTCMDVTSSNGRPGRSPSWPPRPGLYRTSPQDGLPVAGAYPRPGDHPDPRRPCRVGPGWRPRSPRGSTRRSCSPWSGCRWCCCSTAAPASGPSGPWGSAPGCCCWRCCAARPRWYGPRSPSSWPSRPRSSTPSRRCSRSTSTGWTTCRPSSRRGTAWSTSARSRSAGRRGCAGDAPRWSPATVVVGGLYAAWGLLVSARPDVLGAFWYLCLLGFLAWGRSRTLYVGAFLVVTYLELLGTWLGHLGLADPRPDRAGDHRQPAVGGGRRLRLVRPGRRPRRPRPARRRPPASAPAFRSRPRKRDPPSLRMVPARMRELPSTCVNVIDGETAQEVFDG